MSVTGTAQGIDFSGGTSTTIATSTTVTVAAGDWVIAWVYYFDALQTVTVSDGTNSLTQFPAESPVNDGNSRFQAFARYYASGGTFTITATYGAAVAFRGIVVAVCDGHEADALVAAQVSGNVQALPTTAANAVTSGTVTPQTADSTLYALTLNDTAGATPAVGTGFDDEGAFLSYPPNIARLESQILTSATPVAATFTAGVNATHLTLAVTIDTAAAVGPTWNSYYQRVNVPLRL